MIGIPDLRRQEEYVARDVSTGKPRFQRLAHLAFVAVSLCAIEMPEPRFQCIPSRDPGCRGIRNQSAKPQHRNGSYSVPERYPLPTKTFNHPFPFRSRSTFLFFTLDEASWERSRTMGPGISSRNYRTL